MSSFVEIPKLLSLVENFIYKNSPNIMFNIYDHDRRLKFILLNVKHYNNLTIINFEPKNLINRDVYYDVQYDGSLRFDFEFLGLKISGCGSYNLNKKIIQFKIRQQFIIEIILEDGFYLFERNNMISKKNHIMHIVDVFLIIGNKTTNLPIYNKNHDHIMTDLYEIMQLTDHKKFNFIFFNKWLTNNTLPQNIHPKLNKYFINIISQTHKRINQQKYILINNWIRDIFKNKYILNPNISIYAEADIYFSDREQYQILRPLTDANIKHKLNISLKKIKQQCIKCKNNFHSKCSNKLCSNCCTTDFAAVALTGANKLYCNSFHEYRTLKN